jgi:hypothetical protein
MKPSTYQCLGHERLSSANSSSPVTATIPNGTSSVLITVETTSCRWTLTPTGDPTSTTGLVIQPASQPYLALVGQGAVFKFASTAGTASVVQLAYLG